MSATCSSTRVSARLRRAYAAASGEISTAWMSTRVSSVAIALAIAPDPVPSSTTSGRWCSVVISASASMAQPVITSVSGRGTKTPGPTSTSTRRKWARPVRCCSGTRSARRATSRSNRRT